MLPFSFKVSEEWGGLEEKNNKLFTHPELGEAREEILLLTTRIRKS